MSNFLFSSLCKAAVITSLSLGAGSVFLIASAEPAFANNGNGKGNGNSSSNRGNSASNRNDGDRGNSSNSSGNSNSNSNSSRSATGSTQQSAVAVSSELPDVTAAHATPAALSNAAPNSVSGKLATYRTSRLALIDVVQKQNIAYAEYQRLSQMSAAQAAAAFPNGDYNTVLANATAAYVSLHDQASRNQTQAHQALQQVSGGRALSDQTVQRLHAMLGL